MKSYFNALALNSNVIGHRRPRHLPLQLNQLTICSTNNLSDTRTRAVPENAVAEIYRNLFVAQISARACVHAHPYSFAARTRIIAVREG